MQTLRIDMNNKFDASLQVMLTIIVRIKDQTLSSV